MKRFVFNETVIFRYPAFADHQTIFERSERERLRRNPEFMDRLLLASEVFSDRLKSGETNPKIELTLSKYINRASNRSTPFGGFAGNGISRWSDEPSSGHFDENLHCKLDSGLLGHIISTIESNELIRQELTYFKNPTLYTAGDKFRFYDFIGEGSRKYILSSIDKEYGLEFVLERCNRMAYKDIVDALTKEFDATVAEGKKFLDNLIQQTVLFSELQMNVVGRDGLEQLIESLARINYQGKFSPILDPLLEIRKILSLQHLTMEQKIKSIKGLLKENGLYIQLEDYIQVDAYRSFQKNYVHTSVQSELKQAIAFLDKITPRVSNPNLESFKKRFFEKYEDQEIPLLLALDPEKGVGYGQNSGLGSSLTITNGLGLESGGGKRNFQEFKLLHFNVILAKKIVESAEAKEIDLNDLIIDFDYSDIALPPTFSVLFRRLPKDMLLLESTGWATAASMLGRFGNGHTRINGLLAEIAHQDTEGFEDAVIAEVSHLPETRFGNVAYRPKHRDYIIPIISGYESSESMIGLDRINIVLINDRLMLRSVELNKWIIPRISTAHNFSQNTLPVYQFLGDLQNDYHKYWLGIQTDDLAKLGFVRIPRLRLGKVILQLEKWKFSKKDLLNLMVGDFEKFQGQWKIFSESWRLPVIIVLCDHDNELVINQGIQEDLAILHEEIRKKGNLELKEFYVSEAGDYAPQWKNQYLATVNNLEKIRLPKLPEILKNNVRRTFSLGSEWVYVKIYAGYNALENIISSQMNSFLGELVSEDLIEQFFFIRYEDPGRHIRLRMRLRDIKKLGAVLEKVECCFGPLIQQGVVESLNYDTYRRELERYGPQGIGLSEELFFRDSECVLNYFVQRTIFPKKIDDRWLFCMRSIDALMEDFGLAPQDKLRLVSSMADSFYREFKVNNRQKKLISDKYRSSKKEISEYFDMDLQDSIVHRSRKIAPMVKEILSRIESGAISESIDNLLFSYIHMHVNRIFSKDHRKQELVIYDFLRVFYKSKLMRIQYNKSA